jgi:ubiquinol-cytochrome c reductase cytochrome b subunit
MPGLGRECSEPEPQTAPHIEPTRNNAMSGEHSSYTPKTPIGRWLDARLPLPRLVYDSFIVYPVPRNLNYAYTFGGILTMMLGVQIATGIVLAMHYAADTGLAFNSVEQIMRDVNSGWLLRYLHSNGASFFFIAAYVHMLRSLYYGSFKAPRELLWILGCINFLLLMAIAFLGYTLPWGQMSFWGATVITGFFSAIPLVGDWMQQLLLGGFAVNNPTLNRFFALHYLLPFILTGVVILHIWALHVVGQNNPTGVDVKTKTDVVDFTPHATIKDIFGAVAFLVVFAYFVFYVPNFLGHPDNYTIANPLKTPAHIVPEWYFLPFYAMLRSVTFSVGPIDSKLGGVLAMFGAIAVLFFVPWLDTSRVRSAVYRPWYRRIFWLFVANAIFLGWLGSRPAEGAYVLFSQAATLCYFAFFLLAMPLLGLIETPRRLPNAITEAVLEKNMASSDAGADRPVRDA